MRKGTVVRAKDIEFEGGYEVPLRGQDGICSRTVENPRQTVAHVIIPPGGRNQRHYHVNCDAAGYIIKGRVKMFFGPDHEMEELIAEGGDFFYYPQGVIHGLINLSDTEPVELVSTYSGIGGKEEAGTMFVEPPWD